MPDLSFRVEGAGVVPFAASPLLNIKLHIVNRDAEELIQTIALRCQIQIEVTRRRYTAPEQERLHDLYGEPERWSQTLRPMLWTHASVIVPAFSDSTLADLPVACTFDFNVATTKYFAGLDDGEVPLCLLFSVTIFYEAENGAMQVAQISWEKEANYRLPVRIWKEMMDSYYPNTAWLSLRRDVFDRLYQHKMRCGLPTWEQALESLLSTVEEKRAEEIAEERVEERA